MPLVAVKPVSQLPPGRLTVVRTQDSKFVICNVDGTLHCVSGLCPHAGGPLEQGTLEGHTLVCPWHGWRFDCRTGLSTGEKAAKLPTFSVVVQGEMILIEVP